MNRDKIIEIVNINMDLFFDETTKDFTQEEKIELKNGFYKQTLDLAYDSIEKYFMKNDLLTHEDIKLIHKIIFPAWYKKIVENKVMIPWVYRDFEVKSNFTNGYPFSIHTNIYIEMDNLLNKFNKSKKIENNILKFILDLIKIHPFGDGNGRLAAILTDLLYLKFGFEPFYFVKYKKVDKRWLYNAIILSTNKNDMSILHGFLKKCKV